MVKGDDFTNTLRSGGRGGNRFLVVTIAVPNEGTAIGRGKEQPDPVKIGFIVSKRELPRAVDRNHVKRRLRPLLAARLDEFPAGATVVVRALAATKSLDSQLLAEHLDRAIQVSCRRSGKGSSSEAAR